ncbi:hypothetical protein OEZ85_010934 [Tetradesmus obliquus]|uniref:Uncharacterized protein n=1 Tax=Tetradesmus obliquus TaxID=3088 RepID=A0ABY8TNR3_TETOB|nr:hypothetical protein OEZ85_010934 [Tetradesmus obliquus]
MRTAQRRAAQLQAENDWLRWEHQLITEMCKGFDWFRHLKLQALLADPELMMCIGSEQLTHADLQQQLGDSLATEDESRLLRQLSFLPQELQALYKSTVHDLSLYLVQHSAGSVTGSTDEPLKKIQAAMTEHLKMIAQLCTARSELVTALLLSNSDTGEQVAEPDTQRIGWVVERLKLSPHQQHSIARGMGVFKRLLSPVLEELRQLQQQVDECTSPCASTSTGNSEGAAACSGDADGQAQQYSSSSARRRMLEQQEQRSARMKMLLRKDSFLRTWFSTYLYGQLSWVQLARMHVLMVPFYPVSVVFFSEVAAQVAANLAKRQEQVDEDTQDDDSPGSTST